MPPVLLDMDELVAEQPLVVGRLSCNRYQRADGDSAVAGRDRSADPQRVSIAAFDAHGHMFAANTAATAAFEWL